MPRVIAAARLGSLELVKFLYNQSPRCSEGCGKALVEAASHNHIDIVKFLLQSGEIDADHRQISFIKAADGGYTKIVEILLDGGVDGAAGAFMMKMMASFSNSGQAAYAKAGAVASGKK